MTRPFYLIGHNTNSIAEIERGLALGLNAFEIDVNIDDARELYISHDRVGPSERGTEDAPQLVPFLQELGRVADANAGMALVIWDCKFSDADLGQRLLTATREYLTAGGGTPHVIYSVAKLEQARTLFENFLEDLRPKEALMVDEEAEPRRVSAFFRERRVSRACYGDGVTTIAGVRLPIPNLASHMDVAVALRALEDLHFVYPWVLVEAARIREFLRIGVDGIMVDTENTPTLTAVLAEPEFAQQVYVGRREEDPLELDRSLVLEVHTGDVLFAGTGARITFTLTPKRGAPFTRTVDAGLNGRFERRSVTYVTCRGAELSPDSIAAITVSHDGRGVGADWRLDSIVLRGRGAPEKKAVFECEIVANAPVTRPV
jgi:hypothetical protein